MQQSGFFEQKRMSPAGLALVVAGHALVLGAVVMIKGPEFTKKIFDDTDLINIVPPIEDPVEPPPPTPVDKPIQTPRVPTQIDPVDPIVDNLPTDGPVVVNIPTPPTSDSAQPGPTYVPPPLPPLPEPVRHEARFDERFADALQPPYPPSEQRAQRSGQVRLRVTIGTDGRVKAVDKISATSDAFWTMAERHARSRWRFRPATVDGRPVESQKVMTLHFRIEDV